MSDTHPGITEIYIDLPVGITDATTGEARKVVGYMCNACRQARLAGGPNESKRHAHNCCWCESHKRLHRYPEVCPDCANEGREAEARREQDRIARAIPLTPDMEGIFADEDFYSDVNDYFDIHANRAYPDGIDPEWIPIVYEAELGKSPFRFSAEDIIESVNERAEVDEDHMLEPSKEAVAELQASLDEWRAKHVPDGKWYTAGRLVRLDAELELWLAKNPDAVAKGDKNDEDETATQGAQE